MYPRFVELRRTVTTGCALVAAASISLMSLTAQQASATVAPRPAAALPSAAISLTAHYPVGQVETATLAGTTVSYSGWSADRDLPGTVRVAVLFDGGVFKSVLASGPRVDIAKAFPMFGANRGFSGKVAMAIGTHTLCWVAVNLGEGHNNVLACKSFTVPGSPQRKFGPPPVTRPPVGAFDALSYAGGRLYVHGWSADPDDPTSTLVDVVANGLRLGSVSADGIRNDVAQAYPALGARHGFDARVSAPLDPGNYLACVVLLNTAGGKDTTLGCRIFTVLPVGVPNALGANTAVAAAAAVQAQAIGSGAAGVSEFPASASAAARITLAVRALLQQATGRRPGPRVRPGVPAFALAGPNKVVDEQAVMGPTPYLGNYPAATAGGRTGAARSLEGFGGDALWNPGSPGVGLLGAAPVLPANGTTVRPVLPGYPARYVPLRAEVAIGAALAHLGDPYVWAAAGPDTFDCSGLVQWAYAKAGVSLAHYTGSQAVQGVRVKPNQLLPGDLVLFGGDLHHVGIYIGAGYMLDAPDTGAYVRLDKISWFGDFALAVRP